MFRLMQAGKHMGKIVANVEMEDTDLVPIRRTTASLHPNASYLVVGGSGGIGQCISEWLAESGAKSVIILSRSAKSVVNVASYKADMADLGCNLHLVECDISARDDLADVLGDCRASLPPIHESFMLEWFFRLTNLQDSVLERMSVADYETTVKPKVEGSWNLHELLSDTKLEFFIMLSSLTGIFGSSSQSNYAAGGAFQDALATYRTSRGLAGVSIDLSVIDSVGYAAEHEGVAKRPSKIGYRVLSQEDVLEAIERAVASPFCGQLLVGINTSPGPHWDENSSSSMGEDRRSVTLQVHQLAQGTTATMTAASLAEAPASDVELEIAQAATLEEAQHAVVEAICRKLCNIFVIEEQIDVRVPLARYGVDSLVAVEMRNMLALVAGAEMPVF
ncbi:KR domain-containing protein [Truncatella angustata]|uniref:KR domain-containing protein n=1 Tax=Truncatella angustata TaxID=152316 RepID=A0A9P8UJI5_9PEZI|nr:KR domain-containing protein [Truncatella angustata]KAH6653256.1 KR domain-containing protein [Truncatella angustata]